MGAQHPPAVVTGSLLGAQQLSCFRFWSMAQSSSSLSSSSTISSGTPAIASTADSPLCACACACPCPASLLAQHPPAVVTGSLPCACACPDWARPCNDPQAQGSQNEPPHPLKSQPLRAHPTIQRTHIHRHIPARARRKAVCRPIGDGIRFGLRRASANSSRLGRNSPYGHAHAGEGSAVSRPPHVRLSLPKSLVSTHDDSLWSGLRRIQA